MARSSLFGAPASLALRRADSRRSPGREKTSRLLPLSTLLRDARDLVAARKGRLAVGLSLLLVNRVARLVFPGTVKFLMDEVIGKGRRELLGLLLLAAGAATIVQAVTSFGLTQLLGRAAQRSITEMRRRIQRHVGRLSVSYFDQTKAGALTSRVMSDAEGIRSLVGTGFIETVGGLISTILILGILFRLNPRLTLIAVGVLSLFGLLLYWAFRTLRPLYRERSEIQADVAGRLTESFAGVRVVKAYRAERREALVFSRGVHRLYRNISKTMTGFSALSALTTVLLGLVGVLILWIGTEDVLAGRMTLGSLLSFLLYLGLLAGPVFQVVSIGGQISEALAGIERLREILDEPDEEAGGADRKLLPRLNGWVEFRDVSFAYVTDLPVLRGVSFAAAPGTVTALVGSSGAGKSTLIGMVAAFYRPTQGVILVDGNDLASVRLSDYRAQLGVVLQDNFLFDGTVYDNIAFARPDASEAEVQRAAAIARCDDFVRRFPKGYATVVGERGIKLSGGERQRVAIARAILADPAILILDEATSSLDSESEALIQEGLSELMKGRTTFVIAHRLSTIRKADVILVLEEGQILERGRHEDLLARGGRYAELYTRQHAVEVNVFRNPGEAGEEPAAESTVIDATADADL